jgi:DNA-binding NarL/FixJ family response regulator
MFRLTIAADHSVIRAGLRSLVEECADWSIVAEAQDGAEAVSQAVAHKPNVAILSDSLPPANGIEVTRLIKRHAPNVQVFVLMTSSNEQQTREVMSAGARGYLLKSDTAHSLCQALGVAARRNVSSEATYAGPPNDTFILTKQERRIVQLISDGHSTKSISSVLEVSDRTVETHRANLMHKLNLTSIAALVRFAVRNGLIEP